MTIPFDQLPDSTRAWVYTSNRLLTDHEVASITKRLAHFTDEWSSHGAPLNAASIVLDNSVIVIAVENGWDAASGCSIDKSVGVLKAIEQELNVSFFDRLTLLFKENQTASVAFVAVSALKKRIQENEMPLDALFVNTQIDSIKGIKTGIWNDINSSWLVKSMSARIR